MVPKISNARSWNVLFTQESISIFADFPKAAKATALFAGRAGYEVANKLATVTSQVNGLNVVEAE